MEPDMEMEVVFHRIGQRVERVVELTRRYAAFGAFVLVVVSIAI